MRQTFPNVSLGRLCVLFGVTRQAYYEAQIHERKTTIARSLVLSFVKEYRIDIPLVGTRKLYHLIKPLEQLIIWDFLKIIQTIVVLGYIMVYSHQKMAIGIYHILVNKERL